MEQQALALEVHACPFPKLSVILVIDRMADSNKLH
jgi:hypothetical protein